MISSYKGNIYRLYVIKMAKWFSLIMPIVVLYYQDNGLSMKEIFLLKSIYSVGMLTMEIPSGYFGDVWGRKKTLILGSILTTIGFSVYGFANHFWFFATAEVILGIGQSFISGSDTAMLYDTLKEAKKEETYLKEEGKITSIGNFAEAIAGVLSGFIALISLRVPFVLQALISAFAIPAALTLVEPSYSLKNRSVGFKDILQVVYQSLIKDKKLSSFILFSSVIGTATLTYAWFMQPFFIENDLPIPMYGVLMTALNLTVGLVSIYSHKIHAWLGRTKTIILIIGTVVIGFLATGYIMSLYALPILFIFYMMRGVATPVLKEYMQGLIDSDVRATVFSLRNMCIRILFAFIGPLLGWLTDTLSLSAALMISGGIFFFLTLIIAIPILLRKD